MSASNHLIKKLEEVLSYKLPAYPSRVTMDIEDAFIINVAVFAIPKEEKEAIKDSVYDLCDALLEGTGYLAGVTVRDIERTRQYYPEFLPQPPPVAFAQLWTQEVLLPESGYTEAYSYRPQATEYTQLPEDNFALAA
jgi:hypothetical protein